MSDNFEHKHLSQLCTLLNGLAFKPEDWGEYGHPIIRIQNLNGSSDFNFCNRPVPNQYIILPNTVLFSWSGNRGTSFGPYWWKEPAGVLNQHIFKVLPKPDIYPRWLYYGLDLARQEAEQQAHGGSGLVHVRRTDLLKYKIPAPPLSEQRRIAEILDTINETIEKTEALISKLKAMKQGLLHDLLTRGLDKSSKLRDPKAHPEHFKDSPLGRIPRIWATPTLDEITTAPICYGIVQVGPYSNTGVPVLAIRDLHSNYVSNVHKTAPGIDKQYTRSRVASGDLLLSIKGTIGRIGVVPPFFVGNISRDLARIRIIRDVLPDYLRYMFESPFGQNRLSLTVVGTTRAELSIGRLKELCVLIPPLDEQKQITIILDSHSTRIRAEEQYRNKLKLQKKGLMHDLLTGKVRVQI